MLLLGPIAGGELGGGGAKAPPIIFVHKDKRHKEDFLLPKRCLKGHFPAI